MHPQAKTNTQYKETDTHTHVFKVSVHKINVHVDRHREVIGKQVLSVSYCEIHPIIYTENPGKLHILLNKNNAVYS